MTSNDALFKSIDFRKALIEKIYEIVALLEGNLAKILEVGGAELEAYSLVHLTQCSMTLLNIFEDTARMKKLIKAILRVIETLKERVFANKQKALQGLYVTCLAGLKKKLA